MRGQALSTTRKLNRHWQSGGDGGAKLWYNCADVDGVLYYCAPRYLPETLPSWVITGDQAPYTWNPLLSDGSTYGAAWPDIYDGSYTIEVSGETLTVAHATRPNIKLVPAFGAVPYGPNFTLYAYTAKGQPTAIIVDTTQNGRYLCFVVDFVFCKVTGPLVLSPPYFEVSYVSGIDYFSRFFPASVTTPGAEFSPRWQSKSLMDLPWAYAYEGAQFTYNIASTTTQQDIYADPRPINSWACPASYMKGTSGGMILPDEYGGTPFVYGLHQAAAPSGMELRNPSRFITTARTGFGAPVCQRTGFVSDYDPQQGLPQESGWIRDVQITAQNFGTTRYVMLVILKEITAEGRSIHGGSI